MVNEAPTSSGQVLIVCTGNVCRSPFVERMMQTEMREADIEIVSAGTRALIGQPMDPQAADQLLTRGGNPAGFVARQLTAEMIVTADLVLTATRSHRGEVAILYPPALRYVFALRDFADLVRSVEPQEVANAHEVDGLVGVVALVAARRGTIPPRPAPEVDVVDPYRQGRAVFDRMGQQVMSLLPDVVRALTA